MKISSYPPLPDSSSFQESKADLHHEDDNAHDDQEEGVGVEHQHLQTLFQGCDRRVQARHVGVHRLVGRHKRMSE